MRDATRLITATLILNWIHVTYAHESESCPFDLKTTSGWDLVELRKELLEETYGVPKHSFGYRLLTEAPTGFVATKRDASRILDSVFDPFLYKLNATKPDLTPRHVCAYVNWKAKLDRTDSDGMPIDEIRNEVPIKPNCVDAVCSCYLRYSDSCPMGGYKTSYLPVPWWWCYYSCAQT